MKNIKKICKKIKDWYYKDLFYFDKGVKIPFTKKYFRISAGWLIHVESALLVLTLFHENQIYNNYSIFNFRVFKFCIYVGIEKGAAK
jgi:uncharacterized paraquat-inducible protein A